MYAMRFETLIAILVVVAIVAIVWWTVTTKVPERGHDTLHNERERQRERQRKRERQRQREREREREQPTQETPDLLMLQAPGEGETRDAYLPPGQDSASAVVGLYGSSVTTSSATVSGTVK
jgi:cytoskeletal protein RodZ